MSKFKVGDKVRITNRKENNKTGCFGDYNNSKSFNGLFGIIHEIGCDNKCSIYIENTYSGWYQLDEFELVEIKPHPLTNTIITDIRDEAQHKRVQEKLFEIGCEWITTGKSVFTSRLKHVVVDEDGKMCTDSIDHDNFNDFTRITANDFLQEEPVEDKPQPKFKVGDNVRVLLNTNGFKRGDVYTIEEVHTGYLDGEYYYRKTKGEISGLRCHCLELYQELEDTTDQWYNLHGLKRNEERVSIDKDYIKDCDFSIKQEPVEENDLDDMFQASRLGTYLKRGSMIGGDSFQSCTKPKHRWWGKSHADILQNIQKAMEESPLTNKTNITSAKADVIKPMNNIVSFFNDLTVSAEDKELRKAGLKDDNLNWTRDAQEIVKNLESKELGYKNYAELSDRTLCEGLSPLEYNTIFTKFYTKLLDTAKKYNRKDENKAK